MRRKLAFCLAAASLISVSAPVSAAWVFTGPLLSSSEVPINGSPGTGLATVSFNGALDTITVSANFTGLVGTTTAAHIHCCDGPPGFNSGIAIETPSLPGFPLGVTSGSFSNSFNLLDANSYNPSFVTANGGSAASARDALFAGMMAGRSYFNVHTSFRPGGEIRGNLAFVPEPGTWLLMVLGIGAVGAAMRRKRLVTASA